MAEFIGIMLGDGCVGSRYQVSAAFNAVTDAAYGRHVQRLFSTLFGVRATLKRRPGTCSGSVTASSCSLVEQLQQLGLAAGNKVAHQVNVPRWIWTRTNYQRACLRGLMDADGSVYRYHHRVQGRTYEHLALCFTNHSHPLLASMRRLLQRSGFHPRATGRHVALNRRAEISRYFALIGSSNPKHVHRFHAAV